MKTEKQIAAAAAEFAERWKGRGYEKGDSQPFWLELPYYSKRRSTSDPIPTRQALFCRTAIFEASQMDCNL